MKNDKPWKFKITFFVGSDYKGESGDTFHSEVENNHGAFRISGSDGDVDKRTVTVKTVQFNGKIK
ncbi:hypothetical protein D3C79_1042120 [compost metagenome]